MKANWVPVGTCWSRLERRAREAADAPAGVIEHYGLEQAATPVSERPGWRKPKRILVGSCIPGIAEALQSAAPGIEFVVANRGDIAKQAASVDAVIGVCTPDSSPPANRSAGSSWSPPASRTASRFRRARARHPRHQHAAHRRPDHRRARHGDDAGVHARPRSLHVRAAARRVASQHAAGPHGRRRRQDHAGRRTRRHRQRSREARACARHESHRDARQRPHRAGVRELRRLARRVAEARERSGLRRQHRAAHAADDRHLRCRVLREDETDARTSSTSRAAAAS